MRRYPDLWASAILIVIAIPVAVWIHSCGESACHRRGGEYVSIGRTWVCFKDGRPIETFGEGP